jgi:uncharacterized protein YjeT (DUF2065 family)
VKDFSTALALAFVIEGLLYSLMPGVMQRMIAQVAVLPSSAVRIAGLVAACLGVVAIWLIRAGHF